MWKCPIGGRDFTQKNQRHACGTGDRNYVLRGRSDMIINIYNAIEEFILSFGKVEVVARDRYVLFRSSRIFTDLSIMKDSVRIAIHVGRKINNPIFIKIVEDRKQTTHVVKVFDISELEVIRGRTH